MTKEQFESLKKQIIAFGQAKPIAPQEAEEIPSKEMPFKPRPKATPFSKSKQG